MLYAILKPIVTLSLRLYFRHISRAGLEHIDNSRPTLILANHTASFMDAILVACFVKRRIHFFARGDVFGKKWADRILRSIGLLPVYRLSEGRDKLHLNDTSNEEALEILRQGGAVLIFCEGTSDIAKRLKPLKKGPFRLAAIAASTLPEAPEIVPLGINYITPAWPGGDVFLEYAPAMPTADFLKESTEAGLAKGATDMMRQTATALSRLVWHTQRQEDEPIADHLLLRLQESQARYTFEEAQGLMNQLNSANEVETKAVSDVSPQKLYRRKFSAGRILFLLTLLPCAIAGWIFHLPPVNAAQFITKRQVASPDFYAPVYLSCCLLLIAGWYLGWLLLLELLRPSWGWLALMLLAAGCGILYLKAYWPLLRKPQIHNKAINEVEAIQSR